MANTDILKFPNCGLSIKRLIAVALEKDVEQKIPAINLPLLFYDEPKVVISLFVDMLMRRIFSGTYFFKDQPISPGALDLANIARVVEIDVTRHYSRIHTPVYSPVDITQDILRAIEKHTGYVICIAPNTDGG